MKELWKDVNVKQYRSWRERTDRKHSLKGNRACSGRGLVDELLKVTSLGPIVSTRNQMTKQDKTLRVKGANTVFFSETACKKCAYRT